VSTPFILTVMLLVASGALLLGTAVHLAIRLWVVIGRPDFGLELGLLGGALLAFSTALLALKGKL
jgi:hypothetical protein